MNLNFTPSDNNTYEAEQFIRLRNKAIKELAIKRNQELFCKYNHIINDLRLDDHKRIRIKREVLSSKLLEIGISYEELNDFILFILFELTDRDETEEAFRNAFQ